ncbi:MAG: WG repeat-containing protein [Planctomycetaceae bacterium]|nr:WG repeat-containing protein [Planctomycetales bacterium]MCB9873207.1 WG repeat-containing protein [Planctomycetaceae bacterium]MCB9940727.1 WG repeat-containing protein [Planctomycetaceae bacterium]
MKTLYICAGLGVTLLVGLLNSGRLLELSTRDIRTGLADAGISEPVHADALRSRLDFGRRNEPVFPIAGGAAKQWGAIDSNGRILVSTSYERVSRAYAGPPWLLCDTHHEVGQEGALLISDDEWCYVCAEGSYRVHPLVRDVVRVINYGESLFAIVTSTIAPHGPDWSGVKPSFVYDPFGRWQPPTGVYPHERFTEGRVVISHNGRFGFADRTGKVVIDAKFDRALHFQEGLAAVMKGEKWGFVDLDGKTVIPFQYDMSGIFHDGKAIVAVSTGDSPFFIDREGRRLGDVQLSDWRVFQSYALFSEGLRIQGLPPNDEGELFYGYKDAADEWVLAPRWLHISKFSEGLAAVIAPQTGTRSHNDGYRLVEAIERNGTGYIGPDGRLKISLPLAESLREFQYGLAWVKGLRVGDSGGTGYINHDGAFVWRDEPSETEH